MALVPAAARAQWRAAAPLDAPVHGAVAAAEGGAVYLAGGEGLLSAVSDLSIYDPAADAWDVLEPMPAALSGHGMAILDGRIYVAGGVPRGGMADAYDPFAPEEDIVTLPAFAALAAADDDEEAPSARLYIYDIAGERWSEGPPMPAARAGMSLTALSGRLYVTGGGRLAAFDPAARAWLDLGPDPALARARSAAVAWEGRLWVLGAWPAAGDGEADGAAAAQAADPRVDIYDPQTEIWAAGPALPVLLQDFAAVAAADGLHVLGGRDESGQTADAHFVLSGPDGRWMEAEPLPSPRAAVAAAPLPDGGFAVIGGAAGGGFFAPFTAFDTVDISAGPGR